MSEEASLVRDKGQIAELIVTERTARDMAQWDRMLATYSKEALVDISWFQGSGPGFVDASRKHYETGARSLHQLSPSIIEVYGDRAISDTGCAVVINGEAHGVAVRVISYARMYNRFVRENGRWLIAGLRVAYQTDLMVPVNPSQTVAVDEEKLNSFRESYRSLSYLQFASGLSHYSPRLDLAGTDEPEMVTQLLAGEEEWLRS